jgi:hypothetical protein
MDFKIKKKSTRNARKRGFEMEEGKGKCTERNGIKQFEEDAKGFQAGNEHGRRM